MQPDLREIARKAAGKALAERGLGEHASAHPQAPHGAGVHVRIDTPSEPASLPRGRDVVSERDLVRVADGGVLRVPDGALVTPLAEDEARRRGIVLDRSLRGARVSVAIGSDHGGFALKRDVLTWIGELGHHAVDFGTRDENPVDYPDFARAVAEAVAQGQCELGIVIDGAGIGSAIAANKVPGVRAATCCDVAMAKNAREHNFANVLALGGRSLARAAAHDIVRAFLATPTGEERHAKRVAKIGEIERRYSKPHQPGVHT